MKLYSPFSCIARSCLMATCLLMEPAYADPEMPAAPVVDSQVIEEGRISVALAHKTTDLIASLNVPQDAAGVEWILQTVRHPNPYIRYVGMWVLGRTNMPPSSVKTVISNLLTGLTDPDPWVTTQSLNSLGEIWLRFQSTHPSILAVIRPAFIRAASATNPFVRAEAAWGFDYWQGHSSVEKDLKHLLYDPVPLVRSNAYRFFPMANFPLKLLLKGLRDHSASIRYISLNRLRNRGYYKQPDVQQLVIERLRDPDEQIAYESVLFLADYRIEAAIRPMLDLLNKGWERVVKNAIANYTSMPLHEVQKRYRWKPNPNFVLNAPLNSPASETMAQIIQTLESDDDLEKAAALLRLTWVDSKQAEDVLKRALRDNSALARYAAIETIKTRVLSNSLIMTLDVNFDDLVLTLHDAHPQVRKNAIALVGDLYTRPQVTRRPSWDHGRIIEILRACVEKEDDGFIKAAALRTLLQTKEQLAPGLIVKFSRDKFFQVREATVYAMDLLEYPQLLKETLSLFFDPYHKVRLAAVRQFMRPNYSQQFQGNEELVIALRKVATTDPNEVVRNTAYQSLESINGKKTQDGISESLLSVK